MPTVLRIGPYRFFFYSEESGEPAHIHVSSGNKAAKFRLANCELSRAKNFKGHELSELYRLIVEHREKFMEAWNEYFSHTAN